MKTDQTNPPPRDMPDIPFVSDWADRRPFSDLGPGAGGIDWLDRMLKGWEKTRELTEEGGGFEAEVGGWNTVPAGLLELLARQRRAVARIVVPPGQRDYRGVMNDRGWTGTGFLVAPNLLLTNHHVLNSPEAAAVGVAEFEYEWPVDKLFADIATVNPPSVQFRLEPARLFVTSPADQGLDFSFVWISEQAATRFGTIEMERGSFMINQMEPSFVIHHPRGRLKEISLDDTEVLGVNATSLLYAADTDYGSSGACVFNKNGRLVALHHARRAGADMARLYPQMQRQLDDGRPVTVANEGIKISAIALDLEDRARAGKSDSESAAEILRHIKGSDTLTGMFGGLGRNAQRSNDQERVLDLYRGGEQDLDIGFWNLRWLLDAPTDAGRIDAIAAAMMDIKLDVWCLSEAPVNMLAQLVDVIAAKFGLTLEVLHAVPVTAGHVLTTAVLWRKESHDCTRGEWPEAMQGVWTRPLSAADVSDGARALFLTPPPLFRLGKAGAPKQAYAHLVPLDLRDIGQNAKLRRLVSKLVVHAIGLAGNAPDAATDWIVGGDFQPPITREDAATLRPLGYELMGARDDARGGAVSYLRAPRSAVGKVFLSGDLTPVDNDAQFAESVKGRTVDRFFAALSDSRPVVMRLALQGRSGAMSEDDLSRMFSSLTGNMPTPAVTPQNNPGAPAEVPGAAAPASADTALRSWPEGLRSAGLSKPRFLQDNRRVLRGLLDVVNTRLATQYPAGITPLTESDLWVVLYAEAGIKNGLIDPDARHSNGERGLLPLPNNITFWNGPGVPDWHQPMPLDVNLTHYATYLGQLKNKPVKQIGGRMLYRDLFRAPGLQGNDARQARLLAGIVHGYFVSVNYRGRRVPMDDILAGYAADRTIPQILAGSGYVHVGIGILEGRQRNVDAALALLAAS